MLEDEAFAREWEASEKSRHTRVLEEMKREYRLSPRPATPTDQAIDLPYSLKIPRAVSRRKMEQQS